MKAVITTKHRGVFFGEIIEHDEEKSKIVLKDAQMAVYFSMVEYGVLGLASVGPNKNCRIGKPKPGLTIIYDITAVIESTEDAEVEWGKCYWN